ncbi:nuclear pore complex protein Nup133 [Anopheles arabiensis]|uniref:nuclear pore complex protein Nup133 n=1 Tax=Anopheles arabiensis TaxID=7173 RepID=UPI001AAD17E8|nr:nuclear pore complex protein Nup133 [Anopheles arabiensis]
MDRTFSFGGGPIKNSTMSRSRQSLGGSLFSGGARSTNTSTFARQGSGRYSLSSRSNVSTLRVVAKSEYNILESYGFSLPVQVTEVLTFNERSINVSVNYGQNGWAWLVQGRRLFVWQYRDNAGQKSAGSGFGGEPFATPRRPYAGQCRQLTLPHCDIGHKATLVAVFVNEGQQMASCLAVSPAGDVRYWQSIAHDGSSIDECNILEGQEFEQLVGLGGQEFVLATTTCSLMRLNVHLQNGRYVIVPRLIKPPSGFFGGIGKRFASIIIGMNSGQDRENKLVKMSCEKISHNPTEWHVTVLADRWIQRWAVQPQNGIERFLSEDADIMKKMRDFFHQKLWSTRDASEIELWALDMQPTDRGVIILAAAVNQQRSQQVYYALMTVIYEADSTFTLKDTTIMRYKGFYSAERLAELIDFRFIANRSIAYVYNDRCIFPVALNDAGAGSIASTVGGSGGSDGGSSPPTSGSGDDVEKIEFHAREDMILMGNCFQNMPLFFSRLNGMVIVTPSDFDPSDMFNSSVSSDMFNPNGSSIADATVFMQQSIFAPATTNAGNLILYELDPEEIANTATDGPDELDPVHQLKAAFIYHIKRNTVAADGLIASMLELPGQRELVDGELDRTVLKIAIDLAQDTPAADPRWEVTDKHALGSSTSMQIIQQLREKNVAYTQFIEFLHSRKLWDRLNAVTGSAGAGTEAGNARPTSLCLADIGEKIVATIGIKCLHNSHSRIIDEAINLVLRQSNRTVPFPNLTPQDLFYAQTNRVEELFKVLSELVDGYVQQELTALQIQSALVEVNTIVLTVLQEVVKYRESKAGTFTVREELQKRYEQIPWTAMPGKHGLRDVLLQLISCTLRHGVKGTAEPEFRMKHFKHLTELIDYVLDGRKTYLESVHDEEKYAVLLQQYESQRSDLIYPLVEAEQYEMAAKLAEKYLDFQTLVEICDKTNNQERLDEYIERYKEHDFSQFAISWHMNQNRQGDILLRFKNNQSALARFLVDHPSMAWIQLLFNGEIAQAADVLLSLAQREKELLVRKRAMLCLGKLCLLAAEGDTFQGQIDAINAELELIDIQENIPSEILEMFGYDTKHAKVLTPEEIVDLYIADEYSKSSEKEFRYALSLLPYVEDPIEVRHRIWCAAVLRDSWEEYNKNAPLDSMQNMLFFRLIDLCYISDAGELENFLPPLESFLNAPELGDLTQSKSFQYLMKLGYEHINESYRKK